MSIIFPTGTSEIIEEIIEAGGRSVSFFVRESVSGCIDCGINPITNEPLDPFCETCSGIYWIPSYKEEIKTCHITWKDADDMQWVTGGKYFVGDCKIKFIYTAANYIIADTSDYVVVDGKEMTINKITLLGVPTVNRILMHTEEKEKEHE